MTSTLKHYYSFVVITIVTLNLLVVATSSSGDDVDDNFRTSKFFLDRFHLHIGDSNVPYLKVHCRSLDNDLGVMPLLPSQSFHFSFKQNIFFSSFFKCKFSAMTPNNELIKTVIFNVFDLDVSFKCRKTKNCYWLVKDDGFYLSRENKDFPEGWDLMHTWDEPQTQG